MITDEVRAEAEKYSVPFQHLHNNAETKLQRLESERESLLAEKQKLQSELLNDEQLNNAIASNRASRIRKNNNAQVQWNWQKGREDTERRFQQQQANANDSQIRMKVNGAANDIRQKQIAISNDFRQMTNTIDPMARKAYEDKILTDLDQMNLSYNTLLRTYTPEQLASFGLTDMGEYTNKVKEAIKNGKFSADADYAQVADLETEYNGLVRSGTLTDEAKANLLGALEPLIQKGSKEAFSLKQLINSGETGDETLSREQQANTRGRIIQNGNEAADANKLTLDELLAKGTLNKYEEIALENKYTTKQADADTYNAMNINQKKLWQKRNANKFNYLKSKGLI